MKSLKDIANMQVKLPSLKGGGSSPKGADPSPKRKSFSFRGKGKASGASPSAPGPKRSRPSLKGPDVKLPKPVSDVVADLRDRRLLVPVLALLVALVAVPVLLSSSSAPVAPPPSPPVAAEDATAVESAVLTEQIGIRNYQKRLAALKKKNPFEQKFALPEPDTNQDPSANESASTTATDAIASASSGGSSSGGGGTSVTDSVDTSTVDGSTTETVTETVDEPEQVAAPEIRFYAGRIDVTVGPLGQAKTYKNVRYLDFLPNDKLPVVAFLGLGEGGDKAVFSVSSDVAETSGEGSCAPKAPAACQFLTLRIGEQRTLKLADGQTYRLKLLGTEVVRIPDPRGQDEPSNEAPIAGKG